MTKRKNFFMVSNHIFDFALKPIPFTVYCCLAKHRDEKSGSCFPSRKKLAELCRISLQSVDNALRELEAVGLLEKAERYRSNGSRTSNCYHIREPCFSHKTDTG
ncbi:MAG: helix-turn-helix domain-containing protein [Oscillospiraceae bacterium]